MDLIGKMPRFFRTAAAITLMAALPAVAAMPAIGQPIGGHGFVSGAHAGSPNSLSVMSYNVEGLPAPARFGRGASLDLIAGHLAGMRQQGREPDVVMLQEAFAGPAWRIADQAGYRYVATGPSAAALNSQPAPTAAAGFVAAASHLKGEDDGKWLDSGLRILSNYPIARVDRLAFPTWACAGYDCLANKGVVIAWIKVPGSPEPVAFIDTHLNSRAASGVGQARADTAYAYQIATLRRFIAGKVPPGAVAFLGGDFNTGRAKIRWDDLGTGLLSGAHNSLLDALAGERVTKGDLPATQAILRRAKDLLYFRGNRTLPLTLTRFEVPFGLQPDGSSLSDHLGYEVHYRVGAV